MNSEAVQELLAKKPDLKSAKAKFEAMQPGSYCVHRSWGFGQIKAYDDASRKLIIDFEGKPGHQMDPVFCVTTLDVLPDDHVLVRRQTEPDLIRKLVSENAAELVVQSLQAYPNHAATSIELEATLSQVVGEDRFKRWWSSAKRQLAKDPRVGVPVKKTECYFLRHEPISQEDELVEEFNGTRSAKRKIAFAEQLLAAGFDRQSAALSSVLENLAEVVRDSNQLDAAQRLHGVWVRDDLAKRLGRDPAEFTPTQAELVGDARKLESIAEKLPASVFGRYLELIKEAHPLEWKEAAFQLLKTSQGKFTTDCINFLVDNGLGDELAATLKRWQTEQNLRAPVLLWIVKNRHSKKFGPLLHDLIAPRLLGSIFFAIDYEALQSSGARRIPLADVLSDDLELIPDLLAAADSETARDLANALLLNQGFEDLTKKSLLARFIKIFPGVQSLVSGVAEEKEEQLLVSRESYDRFRQEYEKLVSKKIPENSRAIAAAREHGDLRENSEYKMAKQDQQVLLSQKATLERDLGRARITDFQEATNEQVGVGTVIDLRETSSGKASRYTILGAWDSDPDNAVISYKTPLGQALLGCKTGEKVNVQIAGEQYEYEITGISRYADK